GAAGLAGGRSDEDGERVEGAQGRQGRRAQSETGPDRRKGRIATSSRVVDRGERPCLKRNPRLPQRARSGKRNASHRRSSAVPNGAIGSPPIPASRSSARTIPKILIPMASTDSISCATSVFPASTRLRAAYSP